MKKKSGHENSRPRPRLGQNFLADRKAASRMVEALGNLRQAVVLEIGPGSGALTELLAQRARRLVGIEIDRVLAAQLRMQHARHPHVEIIEADVLSVDFLQLIRRTPAPLLQGSAEPAPRASVIGNLPYYITSDILLHLFHYHPCFDTMVLMMQREVADRVAAAPGSRDYGLLSATAQLFAKVEKLFTLPPGAFTPAPRVHSSVLRFTIQPRSASLRVSTGPFLTYLKRGFSQKRKTLFNNLRSHYPEDDIRNAMKRAGTRASVRAEALSLDQSAMLFRYLTRQE